MMMKKFSAVTTFNLKKQPFGFEMLESYFKFWPDDCKMYAFLEEFSHLDSSKVQHKINILDFHQNIPEYNVFKNKYSFRNRTDNFRYDALRFAHKVFAIKKAIYLCNTQYLIWLDSDIKTFKKIDYKFLNSLIKTNYYMSYLGRGHLKDNPNQYSEAGFMIFDLNHEIDKSFWEDMNEMYMGGKLFELDEWHDSYIFDVVRKKIEKNKNIKNINISDLGLKDVGNENHVFVASNLGDYMDHKKGDRKNSKWSREFINRYKLYLEENK